MRSTRLLVAGVALLAVALQACGGEAEPEPTPTAASPATSPSPTVPESPTPAVATPASVDLTGEFWFAGFHVSLESATFEPAGDAGPTVTIDASFENVGASPRIFDGTPSLASGGAFYEPSFTQDLPTVPGLATGAGAFVFTVDEAFTFDDAVLTIGLADRNQAVVPLGGTGEAITLEPRSVRVRGTTKAGAIGVKVTGGELRADVPDRYEQTELGTLSLVLEIDVSNTGSYAGGFAFAFMNNLALELPDGTTVAGDDGPIELLFVNTTLPDQRVRFTIPDPPEGDYALVLIDDTRQRRGRVRFEIA